MNAAHETVAADARPADAMIPTPAPPAAKIVDAFGARTVVWNGLLALFEMTPFNAATDVAARHAAALTKAGRLMSVAGGGDTVAALNASSSAEDFLRLDRRRAFLEWLGRQDPPRGRGARPIDFGRIEEGTMKVSREKALTDPARPVVAVVGGAKVSTKLELLGNLIGKVDSIVIGGGMANTFLAAQGIDVGKSLCEHEMADTARAIMAKAEGANCALVLPVDVVVAAEFKAGSPNEIVAANACPADKMILDAGPASIAKIAAVFGEARTLVWNGPLGAFEIPPFNAATDAAARQAATLTKAGRLLSVAGGGDTVAALNASGSAEDFSYVSTAGGAFLEWLEGKTLPGVAALEQA